MIGPQQVSIGKTAQLVHYFVRGNHFPCTHTGTGTGTGEAAGTRFMMIITALPAQAGPEPATEMQTENINFMNNTAAWPQADPSLG